MGSIQRHHRNRHTWRPEQVSMVRQGRTPDHASLHNVALPHSDLPALLNLSTEHRLAHSTIPRRLTTLDKTKPLLTLQITTRHAQETHHHKRFRGGVYREVIVDQGVRGPL